MSTFEIGDLVVLSAGSMRMAVESVDGDTVHTVWCHEGNIGRDTFNTALLRKWEVREDDGGSRGKPRGDHSHGKPYGGDRSGGDRSGGGKPYGGDRSGGDRSGGGKPRGKPGWDGKPREKSYYRKD